MSRCVKVRYTDEISAKLALASIVHKDSPKRPKTERRAYLCPNCDGWHLTSKPERLRPQPLPASRVRTVATASYASIREAAEKAAFTKRADEVADEMAAMNDADFTDLVRQEVTGALPPEVADVLGNPRICHRWHATIKALQVEAQGRKGAVKYAAALADRRARSVHAIRQADYHPFGIKTAKSVDKPKSARHRAIDRLIERHLDEFNALVAEEDSVGREAS